jgi:hypothetical protein
MAPTMTKLCNVHASAFTPNVDDIPIDDIWYKNEYPALQDDENWEKVSAIEVLL